MKLTKQDVEHVAKLARIGLTEKEIEKFQKELSGILEYVSLLNEVNTDGVAATAQVTGLINITRADEAKPRAIADPEKLLACSPLPKEHRQIKVKNVF